MSTEPCRCCGSTRTRVIGTKPGRFIPREFAFHRCADCGFMFVEPFSGYSVYDDAYYRGEGADPYVDYAAEYRDWRRTPRQYELQDLARLAETHLRRHAAVPESRGAVPPLPAGAPVEWLDFGCGAGALLKFLRERGSLAGRPVAVSGHDVGSFAELLAHTDRFRILDWEQLSAEPDNRYDIISIIEVIEHLPDPRPPLSLLARLLKPGGLLLLTTGNLASPIARRQGIHHRYCTPEIHVSLFNPHCLGLLYRNLGLEPVRVRYRSSIRFKVLKSLTRQPLLQRLARVAVHVPFALRAIDACYGVSDMPCAMKPALKASRPMPANSSSPNAPSLHDLNPTA